MLYLLSGPVHMLLRRRRRARRDLAGSGPDRHEVSSGFRATLGLPAVAVKCPPTSAQRWGLCEPEAHVEPAFWADVRGEALWDFFTLWTLVVAALLLILDHEAWPYFGLVGGGMYLYFAGRGIFTRIELRRRGARIGTPQGLTSAFVFLGLWALMGLATIAVATRELIHLSG